MKIAFVHCRIMPGGALNVLKDLIREEKFKDAKIFTLLTDRTKINVGNGNIVIKTVLPGWINKIFLFFKNKNILILSSIFDYRNLIVFYPLFMKIISKKIKKYNPDKIVISSFAIAKNLEQCLYSVENGKLSSFPQDKIVDSGNQSKPSTSKNPNIKLYLHSPMQYIRDSYEEYIGKVRGIKLLLFKWIVPRLKKRDQKYTNYDEIYFNSKYTKELAKEIYGINGKIKYPNIAKDFYNNKIYTQNRSYYIYIGRLVKFSKECDKIIQLFNEIEEPLLLIGDGPDEKYLKTIAKGNIIFLGRISDSRERIEIMRKAKGLINLTKESFGIVTAESLLLGVPVFGYKKGATPELVDENSGYLIENKDMKNLKKGFLEFKNINFNRELIAKNIREKLS